MKAPRYLIIDSTGMRHEVDEIPAWVTSEDVVLSNHVRTFVSNTETKP